MNKLNRTMAALGFASALGMTSTAIIADQHNFNADQTKAIEKIVHDYLINNPEVMYEVSQALEDKQRQEMNKAAESAIDSNIQQLFKSQSPSLGNPEGDVVLVEFFDYQCGHCKTMEPAIKSLIEADKQLKVVLKELPIFGESSNFAAKAALAAQKQDKYAEFHAALMQEKQKFSDSVVMGIAEKVGLNVEQLKQDMQSEEVQAELDDNMRLARELRLVGTPAFVIGGQLNGAEPQTFFVPGAVGIETLNEMISKARG